MEFLGADLVGHWGTAGCHRQRMFAKKVRIVTVLEVVFVTRGSLWSHPGASQFQYFLKLGTALRVLLVAILLTVPLTAQAQNWDALESAFTGLSDYFSELRELDFEDWQVRAGGAVGRVPDYSGSSRYETRLLPLFQIRYRDNVWLDPLGLRVKVWEADCCRLLAQTGIAPGRNPDPSSPVDLLPNVSSGLDLGATFEGRLAELVAFRIRARKEVAGGHGGVGLSASVGTAVPLGPVRLVPEAAVEWKNGTYMDKFYGVPASSVAVTGLEFYDPKAGIEDIVIRLTAVYDVDENWQILGRAQSGFLMDQARNAPFVRQTGNDLQALVGVGALYTF